MKHTLPLLLTLIALWPATATAQDTPPPVETEAVKAAPEPPVAAPPEEAMPPETPEGAWVPPCDSQSFPAMYDPWIEVEVGELMRVTIAPSNNEVQRCWKNMVIEVVGLPTGADYKYYPERYSGEIIWKPTLDDAGSNEVIVRVKTDLDGWREYTYNLRVRDEWETFWMPGVGYAVHFPVNKARYGMLHGASIEYLIAAWIHRNDNRGPSHGRVYLDIDLLQSTEDLDPALAYHLGLNLSIERNPKRRFWIPFFGVEAGGFYHKTTGNIVQATPLAGLHLWSDQNLFVNVTGGYLFPFTHLEELRGWRVKLGMNLSFW